MKKWQHLPIYDSIPCITKDNTGNIDTKFELLSEPTDAECWNSFAMHHNMDGLRLMVEDGYDINTTLTTGDTLGHLGLIAFDSINADNPLLNFCINYNANFLIKNLDDSESVYYNTCYPSVSSEIYKKIFSCISVSQYDSALRQENSEDIPAIFKLVSSDLNLDKLRFIKKHGINFQQYKWNNYDLHAYAMHKNARQVAYFLTGLEELKDALETTLPVPQPKSKILIKI